MCGTTRGGRYKKCGMVEVIRAQRGRARSALFRRVDVILRSEGGEEGLKKANYLGSFLKYGHLNMYYALNETIVR